MPKELGHRPAESCGNAARSLSPPVPVHAYARSLAEERRGAAIDALRRRAAPHADRARIRDDARRIQVARRLCRDRVRLSRPGAPLDRPGGRRGRRRAGAAPGGPHLRQPPQPRRVHRQGAVGHRTRSTRRRSCASWRSIRAAACSAPSSSMSGRPTTRRLAESFPALRAARRDLHALERLQRRHGRQHARLLPALRRLSEQRHRRGFGRHRHRGGALQEARAARRASRSPISATARPAAGRSGRR